MNIIITDKRRIIEILAVFVTGFGKIIFTDILDLKFLYILTVTFGWVIYFIIRTSKNKSFIEYWGLSFKNSFFTFKIISTIGSVVIGLFIAYSLYFHNFKLTYHIVFVLFTYPIWGLIQQFLMMSLFALNLSEMKSYKINKLSIIVTTAAIFSIVHYPSFPLIIATFFMALFYASIFLKYRNIIPLGIFHGVLGGLFYYFILNRDPWAEFIKMLNV